jgi:hypothetical protein
MYFLPFLSERSSVHCLQEIGAWRRLERVTGNLEVIQMAYRRNGKGVTYGYRTKLGLFRSISENLCDTASASAVRWTPERKGFFVQ